MQAFKHNFLVGLMLIFTNLLVISHDVAFCLAQAADNSIEKTLQEKQSNTPPKVNMRKAENIKKAPLREDDRSWFSRNKWWVALSVILVGGAAAALVNEDEETNDSNEGVYHLEW